MSRFRSYVGLAGTLAGALALAGASTPAGAKARSSAGAAGASATVAVQSGGGADAVPGTLRTLTFGGRTGISIAPGGQAMADAVDLAALLG